MLEISSLFTHYFTATPLVTILHSLTLLKWVALHWTENWKTSQITTHELTLNCARLPCTALTDQLTDWLNSWPSAPFIVMSPVVKSLECLWMTSVFLISQSVLYTFQMIQEVHTGKATWSHCA
jgi:hypothetical protein